MYCGALTRRTCFGRFMHLLIACSLSKPGTGGTRATCNGSFCTVHVRGSDFQRRCVSQRRRRRRRRSTETGWQTSGHGATAPATVPPASRMPFSPPASAASRPTSERSPSASPPLARTCMQRTGCELSRGQEWRWYLRSQSVQSQSGHGAQMLGASACRRLWLARFNCQLICSSHSFRPTVIDHSHRQSRTLVLACSDA